MTKAVREAREEAEQKELFGNGGGGGGGNLPRRPVGRGSPPAVTTKKVPSTSPAEIDFPKGPPPPPALAITTPPVPAPEGAAADSAPVASLQPPDGAAAK